MATEVILLNAVEGLGADGDVVRVADGYARNFLFPKNLAAPVTAATRRKVEKLRADRAAKDAAKKAELQAMADRISAASVTVSVKTGADNRIYGSVTSAHIVESLHLQGIEIDRHQVDLTDPIKELGVFPVSVRVGPELEAKLKVWVVEE